MTEKAKADEVLKPYPDDSEGLSPTVKTVDPEHPASGQTPRGKEEEPSAGN